MLVNLAERFYDPTEGKILLDGTDLRSLPLKQVRSSMLWCTRMYFCFLIQCARMCVWGRKKSWRNRWCPGL